MNNKLLNLFLYTSKSLVNFDFKYRYDFEAEEFVNKNAKEPRKGTVFFNFTKNSLFIIKNDDLIKIKLENEKLRYTPFNGWFKIFSNFQINQNFITFYGKDNKSEYFSLFSNEKEIFRVPLSTRERKTILDLGETNFKIKKMFVESFKNDSQYIYVLTDNSLIIVIDYIKDCENNIKSIENFLTKGGPTNDHKEYTMKILKYSSGKEVCLNHIIYDFKDGLNIKSVQYFSKGESKETLKIHSLFLFKDKYLCVTFKDGKIYLIDKACEPCRIIQIFKAKFGPICNVSFSNDEKLIAISTMDNNSYIYCVSEKDIIFNITGNNNYVTSVWFHKDSKKENLFKKIEFKECLKSELLEGWMKKDRNERRESSTKKIASCYYVYTSSSSGYINSYVIEYTENKAKKSYSSLKDKDNSNGNQYEYPKEITLEDFNDSSKGSFKNIYPISSTKMSENPIVFFHFDNEGLVLVKKRAVDLSSIQVHYLLPTTKILVDSVIFKKYRKKNYEDSINFSKVTNFTENDN